MRPAVQSDYVTFAEELAAAAGRVIKDYWRLPTAVDEKVEAARAMASSPVTAADRGAEEVMRRLIAERYPTHGVLGEEFGPSPVAALGETASASEAEWTWVLDPIDGTKAFVTGKPTFGTLIALCRDGEPVLGVVDQCILGERWVGTAEATTLDGRAVKAVGAERLAEAYSYATTPHMFHRGYERAAFEALRAETKRMLYGCDCYAYALLASGFGVDLVCEADLQPYDYLALVPVLEGAGAVITDWTGQPLTLRSTSGRVVATANSRLHAEALAVLRRPPIGSYLSSYPCSSIAAAFAAGALAATALFRSARHP